jgi:hypothetical protein
MDPVPCADMAVLIPVLPWGCGELPDGNKKDLSQKKGKRARESS